MHPFAFEDDHQLQVLSLPVPVVGSYIWIPEAAADCRKRVVPEKLPHLSECANPASPETKGILRTVARRDHDPKVVVAVVAIIFIPNEGNFARLTRDQDGVAEGPHFLPNVRGVPCREPDSDWKPGVIPALALVSC